MGKDPFCRLFMILFFTLIITAPFPSMVQAIGPDTTAPTVSLTSTLTGLTNQSSTTLNYSADEPATFTIQRNNTPVLVANGGSLTLFEGLNTIKVNATDPAGNIGSASIAVTVDSRIQPPTITTVPTAWYQTGYTLSGRMENGSTVTVSAPAGVDVGPATYPTISSWSCPVTNLTASTTLFSVVATDPAGNISTPATAALVVDLSVPMAIDSRQLIVTDTRQGGTLLVDWSDYTPGSSVAAYALYVQPTPMISVANLSPWRSYPAETTNTTITGLKDQTNIFIAVVPVNNNGEFDDRNLQPVSARSGRQGIYGTVTSRFYNPNFPLNAMQVQVEGYSPILTNSDGTYRLTGLPSGNYTVTVGEPEGTEVRFRRWTTVATVNSGAMTRIDAALTPKVHKLSPGAPQNCTAEAGDHKVTLHWDAVSAPDLAGYTIYRDGIPLNTTLWSDTTYVDLTAENDVSYTYTIKARSRATTVIYSNSSDSLIVTPQAMVLPPIDLSSRLNCDKTVTLTWGAPLSSDLLGYNIYRQNDDNMDYGSYETISAPGVTTWTSPVLSAGIWTFAVRSYGSSEEQNNTVRVTISIPVNWNTPQNAITIPKPGKRLDGNAVHVQAEAVSSCGTAATTTVLFQYRPNGTSTWLDIPAALAQHPNPDQEAPFFTKWDVTSLSEGDYDLRSIASNSVTTDGEPAFITITVDHHQPQQTEKISNDNQTTTQNFIEKGNETPIETGLGSALFAEESLITDTFLRVSALPPELQPNGSTILIAPVDFNLSSGQKVFTAGGEVELALSYNDSDNNGVIDGTGFFSKDALPVAYNQTTGLWEPLTNVTLDQDNMQLKGETAHFSTFTLLPQSGLPLAEAPMSISSSASISTNGEYQIRWNRISGKGVIYELQEADDNTFTQNAAVIFSGNRYFININHDNGTRYYRVRAAQKGHQPSPWVTLATPVIVDLTCTGVRTVNVPSRSSDGNYRLNWSVSPTPGANYDIEVDDGSGYKYLTSSTAHSLQFSNIPSGTYRYRVMAQKAGYKPSNWTYSTGTTVTLNTGNISRVYAPARSSTGSYQVSWSASRTAGAMYILSENGAEIYRGTATFFNFSDKSNGRYSYTVKATRSGYVDSLTKGPVTVTVSR